MKRFFLIYCCVLAMIMMLATSSAFAQDETGMPLSPPKKVDITDPHGIDKVAIDISSGTATITGPTTITLNNVSAMGGTYWVDLQWSDGQNIFIVVDYGLESACGGWEWNNACWYTAPEVGMTCNEVCADKGGFDVVGSQHTGNDVGFHFWPGKYDGYDWVSVECSSTDNNTNWGADGTTPDGSFSHHACYVNCACNE